MTNNTKSSHIKTKSHKEKEVFYRTNKNLTDKTYTHLHLDCEQLTVWLKELLMNAHKNSIHLSLIKYLSKFSKMQNMALQIISSTNKFKSYYEEMDEANEIRPQSKELEQGESGYIFDSVRNWQ